MIFKKPPQRAVFCYIDIVDVLCYIYTQKGNERMKIESFDMTDPKLLRIEGSLSRIIRRCRKSFRCSGLTRWYGSLSSSYQFLLIIGCGLLFVSLVVLPIIDWYMR